MKRLYVLWLLVSSPVLAFAGPFISGGSDGCLAKPYQYTCTVKAEVGDGTVWQQTYQITNEEVTPQPPPRLNLGVCGNPTSNGGSEFYAWLSLNSRKDPAVTATAQIDILESQKTFNLLIQLMDGEEYGGEYTYWAECKKIK